MSDHTQFARQKGGAYRTLTAQAALDVLLSDDFVPLKIPEYYNRLAEELGRDFQNIRFVTQFVPLLHSGPKHRELRRQSAIFLRSRATALERFERQIADLFATKLSRPGRVEVVPEIIDPVFEQAAEAVSGLPYFADALSVFTTYNSLKMAQKIDANFAALREIAQARFPDDSAATHGMRVAFSVLGAAPIGASLAQSLAEVLAGADAVPIRQLNWGKHYVATGLPFLGRESQNGPVKLGADARDVKICEVGLARFLEGGGQPHYMFGAGAHACLGRSTALSLWARIGAVLAQNKLRVRLLDTVQAPRKILAYPSKISIEVLA